MFQNKKINVPVRASLQENIKLFQGCAHQPLFPIFELVVEQSDEF